MLTDFYCEFKERKQVAAIYDSYPLYSYRISVLHPTKHSFEQKMNRRVGREGLLRSRRSYKRYLDDISAFLRKRGSSAEPQKLQEVLG